MEILYTTEYDESLMQGLKHLSNYPQMIPFIGNSWNKKGDKILLLGESHYIPGDELDLIEDATHTTDWYNNNGKGFYQGLADYIDTRGVVEKADKVDEEGFAKPLTIFYNVKKELQNSVSYLNGVKHIFPFISFYNYFQRPAFIEGDSINPRKVDHDVAYDTLKFVTQLIKPKKIIFLSTKAYKSYKAIFSNNIDSSLFQNILIDSVPHPASAWWNKKASTYGNKTGREKFVSLIRS